MQLQLLLKRVYVPLPCLLVCRPDVRERMKNEFLNDENYNFEAVNRASKACGPLVQWAIAQVCVCEGYVVS